MVTKYPVRTETIMPVVRVGSQNGSGIDIYFEDHPLVRP